MPGVWSRSCCSPHKKLITKTPTFERLLYGKFLQKSGHAKIIREYVYLKIHRIISLTKFEILERQHKTIAISKRKRPQDFLYLSKVFGEIFHILIFLLNVIVSLWYEGITSKTKNGFICSTNTLAEASSHNHFHFCKK